MELSCTRCGNQNQRHFKTIKKGTYCTSCIEFGRHFVGQEMVVRQWMIPSLLFPDYVLTYSLTKAQLNCANELIAHIKQHHDVLVYACCGAGKTEIVMPLITYCFKHKLKVGMAIPRQDVVIELERRIRAAYQKINVCAVYGGHQETIDGDIIICTTHQLYRYYQTFDVLIMDEVDAFPYKGNEKLKNIANLACKSNFVYLTATPDQSLKQLVIRKQLHQITLFKRPHGHPLCIPDVTIGFDCLLYIKLFQFLYQYANKIILVFMPSIQSAKKMTSLLALFRKACLFTSKTDNRSDLMALIRNHQYQVVVCTTVLERGVTIPDVQVVVWHADHRIFDEATLIQILGRVGRTVEAYEGKGLLLCRSKSDSVTSCIRSLKMMNAA